MDASKTYSPDEYFQFIKDRKHSVTDEDLTSIYDNCLELLNKYRITGQTKGMRKLIFHLELCLSIKKSCKRAPKK